MQFRSRRRPTSFEVILYADKGRINASIVDITDKGARLRLENGTLAAETQVVLAIRGQDYTAQVVWQRGAEAGVKFDKILTLDVLAAISRSLHRATPTKKRRFLMG